MCIDYLEPIGINTDTKTDTLANCYYLVLNQQFTANANTSVIGKGSDISTIVEMMNRHKSFSVIHKYLINDCA